MVQELACAGEGIQTLPVLELADVKMPRQPLRERESETAQRRRSPTPARELTNEQARRLKLLEPESADAPREPLLFPGLH